MIGCCTSGNSSTFSDQSAKMPKTTSATIVTTVTVGRLMARSERNIGSGPPAGLGARARHHHLRAGGDAAGGAGQHEIAGGDAGDDLDILGVLVGDSQLHG